MQLSKWNKDEDLVTFKLVGLGIMLRYNRSNEQGRRPVSFLDIYSLEKLSWNEIVRMNKDEGQFLF